MKELKFGIIGAGNIAASFAKGLSVVSGATFYAVAARSEERAEAFAKSFGAEKFYGSYEALVQDSEVDVVYVATPNSLHKEHSILAMKHKKHVICEKPFASNEKELKEVIEVAKEADVFLMEAMWTRYFPMIKQVKELIKLGTIGEIKLVQGDFGFTGKSKDNIRYNLSLAGGALMDVGIYPVSFASYIYEKQPTHIKAFGDFSDTGVDERNTVIFQYEEGQLAQLTSAINLQTPRNMYILGSKGYIHIPNVWQARKCFVHVNGEEVQHYEVEWVGNGYNYEIEEVIKCIHEGKKESEIMPLTESLSIMNTMDRIRKEMGVVFLAD